MLIAFVYCHGRALFVGLPRARRARYAAHRLYHANFNLFAFSMFCIPLLSEIGLVWIFVELTTLLSVLLVSYALSTEALEAAWKYMVLTLLGATIAVLGVLVLFWALHTTGSTEFTWNGLRAAATHAARTDGRGIRLAAGRLWSEDRLRSTPHVATRRAQPGAFAGLRDALRHRDERRPLRVLRLRNVFAGDPALHVGIWFAVVGLLSVGVAALHRPNARLQTAFRLFDGRAYGHRS